MDYRWDVGADEDNFAANLRSLRDTVGLTQSALAKLMSQRGFRWHQATVYKIESGERQIQLSEAREVAQILGVSMEQMLAPSAEARVELQLDYDIHRYTAQFDRIGWSVYGLADARAALSRSIKAAREMKGDAGERVKAKLIRAEEVLKLPVEDSVERGKRALHDERVQHRKSLYHQLHGIHDYRPPTSAELAIEEPRLLDNGPDT